MTEPVYEFIKGQGWVVNGFNARTEIIEGIKVTISERRPEDGERFLVYTGSIDNLFDILKTTGWRDIFIRNEHLGRTPAYGPRYHYITDKCFTVEYS